jgi:quercetin dioxygenase-like cupin family protein
MTTTASPLLQPRTAASTADVLGGSISVRLRRDQTAGRLGVVENVIPAGYQFLPLHVHPDFDEVFYVLDGELLFRVADELVTATAGTLVFAPGDVPHTFANLTDTAARMLLVVTPGGHEDYFDLLVQAAQAAPDGWPDPAELTALMRRHGIEAVGSPDPRQPPAG